MSNIIIASLPSRMHMQTELLPAIAAPGAILHTGLEYPGLFGI